MRYLHTLDAEAVDCLLAEHNEVPFEDEPQTDPVREFLDAYFQGGAF